MVKRRHAFLVFLNITGTSFSFLSMKPLDSEVSSEMGLESILDWTLTSLVSYSP